MKMLFFSTAPMGDLEFSIVGLILALLAFAAVIAALLVVVFIVIGKTQPLVMMKQVPPHIGFHPRSHDVPPACHEVHAEIADKVKPQQTESDPDNYFHDRFRSPVKYIFSEQIQQLRKQQING